MKTITMAWRNVQRNTRRTAISATAIGIAAMSIVLLFSLIAGLVQEMSFNLRHFYTGDIRIRHSQYDELAHLNPLHLNVENLSVLSDELSKLNGVISVNPRTIFPAAIYQDEENLNAMGMGIDMQTDSLTPSQYLIEGRLPDKNSREVLLGTQVAQDLGLTIGDKFTALSMTMRRASNGMTFTVVGLVNFPMGDLNARFYAPIETVQRFLKMTDRSVDLAISTESDADFDELVQSIQSTLNEREISELLVEPWDSISTSFALIRLGQMVYFIMGLVFYVLASTVIINTMMMVIFERTREIGTLASLGMDSKRIVRMFIYEAGCISAIGSFVGCAIGVALVLVLEQTGIDFTQAMEGVDSEISGMMYPMLTWPSVVYAFVTGVVVASLASIIPSRRAAKIRPVEAMLSL